MAKYTLKQWIFLCGSYVKKRPYKSHKKGFVLSMVVLSSSFINNFQIGKKRAFNCVFLKQEMH